MTDDEILEISNKARMNRMPQALFNYLTFKVKDFIEEKGGVTGIFGIMRLIEGEHKDSPNPEFYVAETTEFFHQLWKLDLIEFVKTDLKELNETWGGPVEAKAYWAAV